MKIFLFLLVLCCLSYSSCFSQKKDLAEDHFLIVIDIQEYYTKGKLSESAAKSLIDSVNSVINQTKSDHVIYIKRMHRMLNLSLSYPFIYVSYDMAAMRLDKRMKLVSKYFFTNDDTSVFSINGLTGFLKKRKAREIVIIGLMAEESVGESLKDGRKSGYDMYMIPGAIVGQSQKSKDNVIKELSEEGIKILNINTLNVDFTHVKP
jgi:nicotinamidase-related amidase